MLDVPWSIDRVESAHRKNDARPATANLTYKPRNPNTDSRVVVGVVVIVHALQGSSQVLQFRLKVVAVKLGGPPGT